MKKNFRTNHNIIGDNDEFLDDSLNMFDLDNPDIELFNLVDDEMIRLSGSKLLIYKFLRDANHDDVYEEDRMKVISKTPITVYGHYDPRALEENLTEFGIEVTNDQLFTFNKSNLESKIRRPLIPGDIIQPEFQNLKYEVYEVQEDSFEAYGVYHLIASARVLRDNENVQDTVIDPAEGM
jgi:hypothetical protein